MIYTDAPAVSAQLLVNNTTCLDHSQIFHKSDVILTAKINRNLNEPLFKPWLAFSLLIPGRELLNKHSIGGGITYDYFSSNNILANIHLTPADLTLGTDATNNVCKYRLFLISQIDTTEQQQVIAHGIFLLNNLSSPLIFTDFPSRDILGTRGGYLSGSFILSDFEGQIRIEEAAGNETTINVTSSRIDAAAGITLLRTETSNIVSLTFNRRVLAKVFPAHQIIYDNGIPEAVITFCSDYDGTPVTIRRSDGSEQIITLDSGREIPGVAVQLIPSSTTEVTAQAGVSLKTNPSSGVTIQSLEFTEVEINNGLPQNMIVRDSQGREIAALTYFNDYSGQPFTIKTATETLLFTFD